MDWIIDFSGVKESYDRPNKVMWVINFWEVEKGWAHYKNLTQSYFESLKQFL